MQTLFTKNKKQILLITFCMFLLFLNACKHEQTEDIYILYTNDIAGEVYGEVGYSGVKGYKDYLQSEHPYVGLVDAGDFFDGSFSVSDKGAAIVQIMNAVGYEAAALGNQEFWIGLDALANNIKESDFPYLSCNLKYEGSGEDLLKDVKPYVIKQYGWTKIAYIGVTTPETMTPGKPSYEAITENGEFIYSFYEGNDGADLYEQVQKTIDKVRKKVDYVIVLAHLGSNSVTEGFSSYDLIDNTTGIDVVIDGHSHTPISGEGVYDAGGNNVVLTSTGEKLQNLGVLIIHPDHTFNTALYPSVYEKNSAIDELIASLR
ncbi:MAG: metallophosphoesterase [Erysipelotrichaceae bacterium]|nr:metallophosphoesterase [Erysipelotrichaceae bacterium]